ncbi:PqqD family protein [Enterococcus faecalis]|uniref:PqqD family protein n=1 Tax=Enterococcus faecalis TaxID=1351 RepID=UPI0019DBA3DE|nr:PqqD family protein [Enterococcus faecalis]EGO8510070.1 PqqD family protein [Enterococcus faecalis]EGQ7428153.1 PqqD family protein [Enterococcus faecalis]
MLMKKQYFNLIKFEDEFYIVSQLERFKVNMVGARIFDLCNGLNTKEDIIQKIVFKFDLTEDEYKQEIEQFLNTLEQNEIIYEE